MKTLFDRIRFWRGGNDKQSEIGVCLELADVHPDGQRDEHVFKLTHIQAQQLETPDQIITEWMALPNTEVVIYFKRSNIQPIKQG